MEKSKEKKERKEGIMKRGWDEEGRKVKEVVVKRNKRIRRE